MFRSLTSSLSRHCAIAAVLLLASAAAAAACAPVRIAYPDVNRPPYWLGDGTAVAEPPGAAVDLVREFAASAGCRVDLQRMPMLRIRPALQAGAIDFATMDETSERLPGIVFPRDRQGRPDIRRAVQIVIVVFVRARDGIAHDADPAAAFRGRKMGTALGATYAGRLREQGILVETGGKDVSSNLEKLRLGRIDAFAVSLVSPDDMDSFVASHFGGELARLDKPIFTMYNWLGASQAYYDAHREQVETMWNWLGGPGRGFFARTLRKYNDLR